MKYNSLRWKKKNQHTEVRGAEVMVRGAADMTLPCEQSWTSQTIIISNNSIQSSQSTMMIICNHHNLNDDHLQSSQSTMIIMSITISNDGHLQSSQSPMMVIFNHRNLQWWSSSIITISNDGHLQSSQSPMMVIFNHHNLNAYLLRSIWQTWGAIGVGPEDLKIKRDVSHESCKFHSANWQLATLVIVRNLKVQFSYSFSLIVSSSSKGIPNHTQ